MRILDMEFVVSK